MNFLPHAEGRRICDRRSAHCIICQGSTVQLGLLGRMDKASDLESEDCGFESRRGCFCCCLPLCASVCALRRRLVFEAASVLHGISRPLFGNFRTVLSDKSSEPGARVALSLRSCVCAFLSPPLLFCVSFQGHTCEGGEIRERAFRRQS